MNGSRTTQSEDKLAGSEGQHGAARPIAPALTGPQASVLALQRAAGNGAVSAALQSNSPGPPPVQAKLILGAPGDRYEQEADQIAEQVARLRASGNGRSQLLQRQPGRDPLENRSQMPAPAGSGNRPPMAQRQPFDEDDESLFEERAIADDEESEEELLQEELFDEEELDEEEPDEEEDVLQAKNAPGARPQVPPGLASQIETVRGEGRSLPPAQRAFFENQMGHDFGDVRVHTDGRAAELAQALRARAFTVGQDIVFDHGQYAPEGAEGTRLLAHELTHVVQQGQQSQHVLRRAPDKKGESSRRKAYKRYKAKGGKLPFKDWLKQRIGAGKYGPGAVRRHHLVPQEFMKKLPGGKWKHPAVAKRLTTLKIDIHRLVIDIPNKLHNKIHKAKWNAELKRWFAKNPNFTKKQLQQQINSMLKKYGVPKRYWAPAERYGRKPRKGKFYERRRKGKRKHKRRAAARKKAASKKPKPVKTKTPPKTTTGRKAATGKTAKVKTGTKAPRINLKKLRFPKLRFGGIKGSNIIIFVGMTVLEYFIGSWLAEREQKRLEAEIERRINELSTQVEKKLETALKAREAEFLSLLEKNPDKPIYVNVKYRLTFHVTKSGIAATETARDVWSLDLVSAGYSQEPVKDTDKVRTEDVTGCGAVSGQIFELEHHPIVASESFPVRELFEVEE